MTEATTSSPNLFQELLRYGFGGFLTMIGCWGSFFFMLEVLELHYLVCTNLATVFAWGLGYCIHKFFVFRNTENEHLKQGSKFILLQGFLLLLSNVLMFVQIDILEFHKYFSLIAMTILVTVMNYIGMKLLVFGRGENPSP